MSPSQSSALLSAISAELCEMASAVNSLSSLVADHVLQSQGEARARALVDAQAIDALSQRLEALSEVTGAAAQGHDIAMVLAGVRLSDLAGRLGRGVPGAASEPSQASGDLMLFET